MPPRSQLATLQTHHGLYDVSSYQLINYGFNSLYSIVVSLRFNTDKVAKHFTAGKVFFKPQKNSPYYIPADIKQVCVKKLDNDFFLYKISLNTPLYRLESQRINYVYSNRILSEIIRTLLEKYDILNVLLTFKDKRIPFLLQHQQTDLGFLYNLIHQHGLIFFFEQSNGMFIITDTINSIAPKKASHHYQVENNHLHYLHLQVFYQTLPESMSFKALNTQNYHQIFEVKSQNKTDITGFGNAAIFCPYAISSEPEALDALNSLREQIDGLRKLYLIKTSHRNFNIGEVLTLTHENSTIQLRILSVEMNITDTHKQSILILQPSNIEYKQLDPLVFDSGFVHHLSTKLQGFLSVERSLPHVLLAPNKVKNPLIFLRANVIDAMQTPPHNNKNQYQLKFLAHGGDNTPHIPCLSLFYGKSGQGSYLPFYAHSTVMVGFIHNSPFYPIILGAMTDKNTNDDKYRYFLRSYKNLFVAIKTKRPSIEIGKENGPSIKLQNERESKALIMAKQEALSLYAKKTFNIEAEKIFFKAGDISVHVKKELSIIASTMVMKTPQCSFQSSLQLLINAKQLTIGANICIQSQKTQLYAKDALNISTQSINGHGSTNYFAREKLIIHCKGYRLIFHQDGSITSTAPIKVVAPQHNISPQTKWLNPK